MTFCQIENSRIRPEIKDCNRAGSEVSADGQVPVVFRLVDVKLEFERGC